MAKRAVTKYTLNGVTVRAGFEHGGKFAITIESDDLKLIGTIRIIEVEEFLSAVRGLHNDGLLLVSHPGGRL